MHWARVAGRLIGLAAIAAWLAYGFTQPAPLLFKGISAALVAVSVVSPTWGLVAFAGLAPVSIALANSLGAFGLSGQLLEQAALAIGAGTMVRAFRPEERTRIGAPAAVVASIAVASAATLVVAGFFIPIAGIIHPPGWHFAQFMDRRLAQASELWAPAFAAVVALASAVLAWAAERSGRQHPELVSRIIAVSLIGYAAAAVLNVETIIRLATDTGNMLGSLPYLLVSQRISRQTDVHAAASAFLLAGFAGAGLLRGGARNAAVVLLLAVVALGLWITGSRVAVALGLIAVIGSAGWTLSRRVGWRLIIPGVAIAGVAISMWALTLFPSGYSPVSVSVSSRMVLARAGLEMVKEAPAFGIGITGFYLKSAAVAGTDIERFTAYKRENAHNNFIQVAAEQGLVGLAAMLWWLGVVLVGGWRAQMARADRLRGALLLAIVACVGTWMTGHPLLVPEFAFVFWLYCGALLATTPAPASRTRWIVPTVIVVVLASVPLRAWTLRNAAELEHIGLGLSLWQHDDEQRYREAGAWFAIYLPATDGPVVVPMRRAPGAPELIVIDAKIRGHIVSTITLRGNAWQAPVIHVSHKWRRFELAEFVVRPLPSGDQASGVLVRAGKAYQPAAGK